MFDGYINHKWHFSSSQTVSLPEGNGDQWMTNDDDMGEKNIDFRGSFGW